MAPPSDQAPFTGRERELAVLLERLRAAGRGQGSVALVAGESGIGKTRLLAELARQARAGGWRVLRGRAYESEGMPPYLPFVEALRGYLRTADVEQLRRQLGSGGADVALLLPELRDLLIDLPERPTLSPEQEHYRLFESVTALLLAIAQPETRNSDEGRGPDSPRRAGVRVQLSGGLLLVLDDLHWADKPSLLLLLHLFHRLPGAPLLVAGAYRSEELDRTHPLTAVLGDLQRDRTCERLALGPLSAEETRAFMAGMTGGPVAPAAVEVVFRETEGNPFFVGELVRHLLAEGRDLAAAEAPVAGWGVPDGAREVIGRRLVRLSADAVRLLQSGAVLGNGFTFDLLAGVSDINDRPLMDALDDVIDAGLLREEDDPQPGGAGRYSFSLAVIRKILYEELRAPRRQRLHLLAAETIERVHARNLEPHLAALAAHYRLAGSAADLTKAIEYAVRAGEAARAVFAWDEAAAHWQTALDLLHEQGAAPERRAALLEQLADLLRTSHDDQERRVACLDEAVRLYEAAGDAAAAARARVAVAIALTAIGPTQDLDRALAHLRTAEGVLARAPDDVSAGYAAHALARVSLFAVRTEEGLDTARRALALAEHAGDERLLVTVAPTLASHLLAGGHVAEGLAMLERGWQIADRLNDAGIAFAVTATAVNLLRLLHDFPAGVAWCERELATPRRMSGSGGREVVLAYLARALGECGHAGEARRLAQQIPAQPRTFLAGHFLDLALAGWDGAWERSDALTERIRNEFRRAGSRVLLAEQAVTTALTPQARGEYGRAEMLLQEGLAIGVDGSHVLIELGTRTGLALLYAEQGRPDAARPHLARCDAILAGGEDWRGLAGRVALAAAAIAASGGQPAEAERRLDEAVTIFRRHNAPWDEADAHRAVGMALLTAGWPARAAEQLDAAAAIYRDIGAGAPWQDLMRTTRLTRPAGERVTPKPEQDTGGATPPAPADPGRRAPGMPYALSEREAEVLRLVAAGKSNPEIADALVISLNTVYRHVNHIFGKIGVSNRVEAATYAHRHGLIAE